MTHPVVKGGFLAAAAIGVTVLLSSPRAESENPAAVVAKVSTASVCDPAYKPAYYSRFPRVHLVDSFQALKRGDRCTRVGAPLPIMDSNTVLHTLRLDQV